MDALSIRFVIAAYAITWAVLAAYAVYVHGAVRRARTELERTPARATEAP